MITSYFMLATAVGVNARVKTNVWAVIMGEDGGGVVFEKLRGTCPRFLRLATPFGVRVGLKVKPLKAICGVEPGSAAGRLDYCAHEKRLAARGFVASLIFLGKRAGKNPCMNFRVSSAHENLRKGGRASLPFG